VCFPVAVILPVACSLNLYLYLSWCGNYSSECTWPKE